MLIALYLAVTVTGNLGALYFGPGSAVIGAFFFIGIDMAARDALHERWEHRHLWRNMALLLAAGSLLSWLLNRGTGRIALASFVAFSLSGLADALVYQLLAGYPRLVRANASNLLSATVDSFLFLTLAWGLFMPALVLGQIVAKILGGGVWSLALAWWRERSA